MSPTETVFDEIELRVKDIEEVVAEPEITGLDPVAFGLKVYKVLDAGLG
jgi:translation elongation factor EF-1beta